MNSAKKNTELTGAFDLFPKSLEAVKRNLNTFSILWLLPMLSILGSTIYERSHPRGDEWSSFSGFFNFSGLSGYSLGSAVGFGVFIATAIFLLSLIVQVMTYALQLEAAQGKTPNLSHLFEVAKKYWFKLFGMIIIIAILTIVGLILFIIPGLIVIRRYFLAPYVLLDKKISIREAMEESAKLSKPHSGYIWSIIGVMILLSLPSIIPVFGVVISFLLTAIYSVAPALRYEELKKLDSV